MGPLYQTGNNKIGKYTKKRGSIQHERLQITGRRLHDEDAARAEVTITTNKETITATDLLYKVVAGQIPAMPPDQLLDFHRQKRQIRAKTFEHYESKNIVQTSVRNNSKAVVIPRSNTEQYRHSFFVLTALDWNHLDDNAVLAEKPEGFKAAIADHRD